MAESSQQPSEQSIKVMPATDPAVRLFIVAALLIGFGVWCIIDLPKYARPDEPFSLQTVNEWAGYLFNYTGAVVFPIAGLIPLAMAVRHLRRKIVADSRNLIIGTGPAIAWETITLVDPSQLRDKGILRLNYEPGGTVRLDSWKYRTEDFRRLVSAIESQAPPRAFQKGVAS